MTHIDFISATFTSSTCNLGLKVITDFEWVVKKILPIELHPGRYKISDGDIVSRRPFKAGAHFSQGWSIYWGSQDYILIEISGHGCSKIDTVALLDFFLGTQGPDMSLVNITRIDIAHDIETDVNPFQAVSEWHIHDKIKTRSIQSSQSGQTFYVGSRNSDRFCRVYKYNEPHPRSDLLRIEFQYGKRIATELAIGLTIHKTPLESFFTGAMGSTFINAPKIEKSAPQSVSRVSERKNADSVTWVYKQVLPALSRLILEGEISKQNFLIMLDEELQKRQ